MKRRYKRRNLKAGLPPESLVRAGTAVALTGDHVTIDYCQYDENFFEETILPLEKVTPNFSRGDRPSWIHVKGLGSAEVIKKVGETFKIHPLVLEDILHTEQRPKVEDHDSFLFCVIKTVGPSSQESTPHFRQLSLILLNNLLITFEEGKEDVIFQLKERLRTAKGKVRRMGVDYLFYAIIDFTVDTYFVSLDQAREKLDEIESILFSMSNKVNFENIYYLKNEIVALKKNIYPVKEVTNSLIKTDSPHISESITLYLKDLHDHISQVHDEISTLNESSTGLLETFVSLNSFRMNQIIKLLTIFTAIFMPLTFVTGFYGMNFQYLPGASWAHMPWIVLSFLIFLSIGMFLYFKRKSWI